MMQKVETEVDRRNMKNLTKLLKLYSNCFSSQTKPFVCLLKLGLKLWCISGPMCPDKVCRATKFVLLHQQTISWACSAWHSSRGSSWTLPSRNGEDSQNFLLETSSALLNVFTNLETFDLERNSLVVLTNSNKMRNIFHGKTLISFKHN